MVHANPRAYSRDANRAVIEEEVDEYEEEQKEIAKQEQADYEAYCALQDERDNMWESWRRGDIALRPDLLKPLDDRD